VTDAKNGHVDLRGIPPSSHLAVFRLIKERESLDEDTLDALMTRWLIALAGSKRRNFLALEKEN